VVRRNFLDRTVDLAGAQPTVLHSSHQIGEVAEVAGLEGPFAGPGLPLTPLLRRTDWRPPGNHLRTPLPAYG
jgi:hypothetical protein